MAEEESVLAPDALSDTEIVALMGEVEDDTAPRPMSLQEIIHRGDETVPVPMWVSALAESGWIPMYHVATRERSLVSRNAAPMKLKEVDPETGKRAWTLTRPAQPPWRGTLRCVLHPDNPNRAEYDRMGFPTCRKSNLPNELHQRMHMEHRHPMVSKLLAERLSKGEKEAELMERRAEREHQRALLEGMAGRAVTSEVAAAPPANTVTGTCSTCSQEFSAGSTGGLANKLRLHQRKHGGAT